MSSTGTIIKTYSHLQLQLHRLCDIACRMRIILLLITICCIRAMSVAKKANYVVTLLPGIAIVKLILKMVYLLLLYSFLGDGIGPEIMQATLPCLNALGKKNGFTFTFREADIGGIAIDRHNGTFLLIKSIF